MGYYSVSCPRTDYDLPTTLDVDCPLEGGHLKDHHLEGYLYKGCPSRNRLGTGCPRVSCPQGGCDLPKAPDLRCLRADCPQESFAEYRHPVGCFGVDQRVAEARQAVADQNLGDLIGLVHIR